ncbi:stage II sporulation protein D [Halobacillus mangrovi]|uniref:Stage II sporulation protein D n=1 Tax=Halobacillus mangrovi TaxID=402384 RepID=A0A1W5ZS58_9BACI|nr:stage II sporulation protein D [Halobacillus mangrovi]ARI76087.1 stage II sporulation protein D [Halobacillus mangrovi]
MRRQKWLGLIVASGLFMAILIIPTLIVVPFIGSNEVNVVQEAPSTKEESAGELSEDLSSFSIRVLRSGSGEVEKVPLETYVARVVASEMPATFEIEALKAQALAARTYITRHLVQESAVSSEADVTDTVNHQVYKNDQELRQQWQDRYAANMEKINQAVKATAGEIITYEHQPITAAFFSTSNGYTENAEDYWEDEIPYLRSVESPWDEASPKFVDQKVVSLEELQSSLGVALNTDLRNTKMTKTEGNRVEKVVFGEQAFSGREIREKLSLPSSDFTIQQKGDHVIFTTKGYGHGVGMSQYGANGMAMNGKSYKDIVHHYYQNTEISPMSKQTASLMEGEKPVN